MKRFPLRKLRQDLQLFELATRADAMRGAAKPEEMATIHKEFLVVRRRFIEKLGKLEHYARQDYRYQE